MKEVTKESFKFDELQNDLSNSQFLMVKDIYCATKKQLTPQIACFLSFLVFKSDKFINNNPGIRPFIGWSNETLSHHYSKKWFKTSKRSIAAMLKQLKELNIIKIEHEGSPLRRIYINYEVLIPEKFENGNESELMKQKEERIKELEEQTRKLQNRISELTLLLAKNEGQDVSNEDMGYYVEKLFKIGYLKEKDNLTAMELKRFDTMLHCYFELFINEPDKDFFQAINYICKHAKGKIKDKRAYMESSLDSYLKRPSTYEPGEDFEL